MTGLDTARGLTGSVGPAWTAPTALGLVVALGLMVGACGGDDPQPQRRDRAAWRRPPAPARAPSGRAVTAEAIEAEVHRQVNAERRAAGLPPLAIQPGLLAAARGHSADMARRGYFSHYSPEGRAVRERYAAAGFDCRVPLGGGRFSLGGENIAQTHLFQGYRVHADGRRVPIGARTADEVAARVVRGWMESPGHRANVLRTTFRTEAIGVAVDAEGRVFVTQNFC